MSRPRVSLGVIAWNEEAAIGPMLASVFQQSFFARLAERGRRSEIICVTNGCTDRTPDIARAVLETQLREHPCAGAFEAGVADLPEKGKLNAWNVFVHRLSAPEAEFLFLMDGDIVLEHPDTLWNMYLALEQHPAASIATDQPLKDLEFKEKKSVLDRLSLAGSRLTQLAVPQVTGQLYCVRAAVARKIYLPRDLVACEDGFIKSLVYTDFLTREAAPERIVAAPNASHIFQAYTSWRDLLNNQMRQMIGQTIVHLLIDQDLQSLPRAQKLALAQTLQSRDATDPLWLKRRVRDHLGRIRFWQLFPGIPSSRFRRLGALRGMARLKYLPAALTGWVLTLIACHRACQFLRQGYTDFWPDTASPGLWRFHRSSSAKSPFANSTPPPSRS